MLSLPFPTRKVMASVSYARFSRMMMFCLIFDVRKLTYILVINRLPRRQWLLSGLLCCGLYDSGKFRFLRNIHFKSIPCG